MQPNSRRLPECCKKGICTHLIAASSLSPDGRADTADRLLEALEGDSSPDGETFLLTLKGMLKSAALAGDVLWPSEEALSMLRHFSRAPYHNDRMWEQARVLVHDMAERTQAHRRLMDQRQARVLIGVTRRFIDATTLGHLTQILQEELHNLEIRSVWICMYEELDLPQRRARVVSRAGIGVGIDAAHTPFDAGELLPRGLWPRSPYRMLVWPITFAGIEVGYIVLDYDLRSGTFAVDLCQQLSSTLFRISREREVERLHRLEREQAEKLMRAHDALKENQEKLIIAEKMAALGKLTAGLAHEMNTPVAAARAAFSELAHLAQDYVIADGDPTARADEKNNIGAEMSKTIDVGKSATERLAGFLQRIRLKTRNLAQRERSSFDPVSVIDDAILLLHQACSDANCVVSFEHASSVPPLFGSPETFLHIVSNLVTNAIEATRPKGGGAIAVRLLPLECGMELCVTDGGVGISADVMNKIFDPLFTTKPFGQGSGLGLTLVHDMLVSEFGGSIDVESRIGQGTSFVLRFPTSQKPSSDVGSKPRMRVGRSAARR